MHADSRQTDFCTYLSAILLVGLVLNALLGWWWADPVAALAWCRSSRRKPLRPREDARVAVARVILAAAKRPLRRSESHHPGTALAQLQPVLQRADGGEGIEVGAGC
jgi:hypothetical protein